MSLPDAYCRVNRARGFELLSPEDFSQACRLMNELNLPVKLRTFDSGVLVLQLQSQTDTKFDKETAQLVHRSTQLRLTIPRSKISYFSTPFLNDQLQEKSSLTVFEMSQLLSISVLLASERLHSAEKAGLACRDDTIRGLVFYPNLFLNVN